MEQILFFASFIVLATIGMGVYFSLHQQHGDQVVVKTWLRRNLAVFIPTILGAYVLLAPQAVHAATGDGVNGLGLLAAALATGLATIGTGYAVGVVGSAALGAVSEDDSILGKTLIFVGLAEGIAIYGLIISIMILGKL